VKQFLQKLLIFGLTGTLLFATLFLSTDFLINRPENFQIAPTYSTLIIGHSHSECSLNDSLIDHTLNLSQSGESFFYSYFKVKKLLEANPGIRRIYIEFTNNCITTEMNEWMYSDKYLNYRYPKYSAMMGLGAKYQLFRHNPKAFMNAQPVSVKTKLKYLFLHRSTFIQDADWGNYLPVYHTLAAADSLKMVEKIGALPIGELPEDNLVYLRKLVDLCFEHHIEVSFIRSPQHHAYPLRKNQPIFDSILKKRFFDVRFLDFNDFPILKGEFADLEHLNFAGSTRFSTAMDTLLKAE